MPYDLESKLVIGVASSAMFDLTESDRIFRDSGEEAYRAFQEKNVGVPLSPGVAFHFVRRLLSLNDLADPSEPLVEVVLLSRNDPDTGLRVMKSIAHHGLAMTRAVFLQGRSPYRYIPAFNISLFLSANRSDVVEAIALNHPAGVVLDSEVNDDPDDHEIRIAFDFDGVIVDDESESVMQTKDLTAFHAHEAKNVMRPHNPGPLSEFLKKVNTIQKVELRKKEREPSYSLRLRVSIVTARNAPSHERALNTLKSWGVMVNDGFFLGGVEKRRVLQVLSPHIFFDDQAGHLTGAATVVPSVHIPFGVTNV